MFEITKKSTEELTKVDIYRMVRDSQIKSFKDVEDGTVIPVAKWLVFEDTKEDTGETNTILSVMDNDNNVYSAQSATLMRSFFEIVNIMDGDSFSIVKMSGKTKSNRDFINCGLA